MSRENVETVRTLYLDFERGDFWSRASLFHPDVEFKRIGVTGDAVALGGEWHGIAAMTSAFREWLEAWDDLQLEAEDFLERGETVVVLVKRRATARASGLPFEQRGADVLTLRNRKIVSLHTYWDRDEALEAAGLLE